MDEPEAAGAVGVEGFRRLLFSVAYRLVGTAHDAEDAVQEAFSRWHQLDADEQALTVSPRSWLIQATSRACLEHLGSAIEKRIRRRRLAA